MWEAGVALLPIAVMFALLFLLRQTAVKAGIGALGTAVWIALFIPRFELEAIRIVDAAIRGSLIAAMVAYVLLFGILLFHLMNETGLIKAIASFISRTTDDAVRQVLLLVVAFSPLVESASGFGIAILVVAPILAELGFPRFKAALLSLLGLSAVPWGALATGTVIGANLTGIPLQTLGSGTALMNLPAFFYFPLVATWVAGGWRGIREKWVELLAVSGSLAVSVWLFSTYVSVELAGVFASFVAAGIGLWLIRVSPSSGSASVQDLRIVSKALSPYLLLTGLLFVSRLVPAVEDALSAHFVIELPRYSFQLPLLYSPGFFVFLACLYTVILMKIPAGTVRKALGSTARQWIPVTLTTVGLCAMSEVMSSAGMTTVLAQAAVLALGPAYALFSPLIGGLGGFLTGSNAASNAMFIQFQVEAARQLGIPAEVFANAQNTGGSLLTMASPSRVVLGVSACGIRAEESKLLRQILGIALGGVLCVMLGLLFFLM